MFSTRIIEPTFDKQKYNLEYFRNVTHSALLYLLLKDRAKYTVTIQN